MLRRLIFRNFRYFYRADQWVQRRLTYAGRLMVAGLVASGAFGVDTRQTQSYQLFAALLALLGLAIVARWFARPRVQARRLLPLFATVGEPLVYRVQVCNQTRRRLAGLWVSEIFDFPLPTFEELYRAREPGEQRRNWFDRTVGYPRWLWLVARGQGAEVGERPVPPLGPSETVGLDLRLQPVRRGYVRFRGLAIAQADPLGLVRSVATVSDPQSLLVLPKRYAVPPLRLPARRHNQAHGVVPLSAAGASQEFFSLRDYRPGDPWRQIHWRSWAKRGSPVVKEFREEFAARQAVLLDTFAREGQEELFEEAVSVAASFVCSQIRPETLLDLVVLGPKSRYLTAGAGLALVEHLLEVLACVTPNTHRDPHDLENAVCARAGSLSACLCILLDWDGARQRLVAALKALSVAVRVLVLSEAEQPLEPGPMADQPQDLTAVPVDRVAQVLARL
jgi:uncharacterized protein (DUF58 family)